MADIYFDSCSFKTVTSYQCSQPVSRDYNSWLLSDLFPLEKSKPLRTVRSKSQN